MARTQLAPPAWHRPFLVAAAVAGTLLPWAMFIAFFADEGLDAVAFAKALFANGAAAGFSTDVLISIVVFLVWPAWDAASRGVRRWWPVLLACLSVGLSLGLPLYLLMRYREPPAAPG